MLRGSLMKKLLPQHRMSRTDQVLHRVQDAVVADQVVQPGEQQMRLLAQRARQGAGTALERLQPGAQRPGLGGGERPHRSIVAGLVVLPHGGVGQGLHAVSPEWFGL